MTEVLSNLLIGSNRTFFVSFYPSQFFFLLLKGGGHFELPQPGESGWEHHPDAGQIILKCDDDHSYLGPMVVV